FGMCFDTANRLWIVGNDPDSMPPNRLMHVVPGGDFGFQFRFGRAGIHPLQSWNGEFPGTLPMVAGTGEAACNVVTQGRHLWVTSWGDNRIERHSPQQRGASFNSQAEIVVQGDANFRPVGMAVARDDSIYVTDWVDRSYPVHDKGRLWRISHKPGVLTESGSMPELTDAERTAMRLRGRVDVAAEERLIALDNDDPFIRQAAITGLIESNQLDSIDRAELTSSRQRVGLLTAWRWKELSEPASLTTDQRRSLLEWGFQSDGDDIVLSAMRWATERSCKDQLPVIHGMLSRDNLSSRMYSAVIASIAYLETGSASGKSRDPAIEKLLVEFARDPQRPARLRGLALRRIPVESDSPTDDELGEWLAMERDRTFASEVVRLLAARSTESARNHLVTIAGDKVLDVQTRADALASLSETTESYADVIDNLSMAKEPVLETEIRRIRNPKSQPGKQTHPGRDDLDAWSALVGDGGNAEAGRRVFFRRQCATCHEHSGRGAKTGPDLTSLVGQMTRRRVLESILQPGKEVGPLYVPWIVETTDGRVLTGLKLDRAGVGNSVRFQGADGKIYEVPLQEIAMQTATNQSIMPNGLEESMSVDEFRDLIAFLIEQ
ncbi:MAG: c-type cytochrome, partial [Planctomycetota bacterium]|nr:c-type cytochrome [Planctomycetota bacterium]